MGKNAEKKLKKVHLETEKEIVEAQPVEEKVNKPNFGKELKQSLIRENSYISEVLGIVNFPKRDDSDDEDVTGKQGKLSLKKGAQSTAELRARLKAKLDELQAGKGPGKANKSNKVSAEEKKAKKKEELRLKAKLAKINANKSATVNGLPKAKPVYNNEGQMVYSKFDFTNDKKANKKKIDPKAALTNIQKQKQKIKKIEAKGDTETVKEMQETSTWSKALEKTEGAKVKDDVELLKKSIKKQEQRKKSSAKKWTAKNADVNKRKEAKIQKREDNLKKRKKDVKDNKMKKLAKKGRVPGFR